VFSWGEYFVCGDGVNYPEKQTMCAGPPSGVEELVGKTFMRTLEGHDTHVFEEAYPN
jgi:hypothetical protein